MPVRKPGKSQIPETLTDRQLVRRVLAGEAALFEILVHRHSQRLYRAARAILRSDYEASDVVQETYLRAYRKLDQFSGKAKFSTWLTRIAIYEALARKRKGGTHDRDPRSTSVAIAAWNQRSPDDPERLALVGEVRTILEAAIDSLPDMYRTVFVLRGVEEMSTADTADCLNLSEDVVKTRLRRARASLRKKLDSSVGPMRREAFRFAGERCRRMWSKGIFPAIRSCGRPDSSPTRR